MTVETTRETIERVMGAEAADKPAAPQEAVDKPAPVAADKPIDKPAETAAEKPDAADKEIPDQTTGEKADTDADASTIAPPKSWSKENRELWASIPPAVQAVIHKREIEIANAARKYGNEAKQIREQYGEIGQFVEGNRERWAINGYTPSQAIAQLVALDNLAQKDPVQFIQLAAQRAGIDLRQLATGGAQTAQPQPQQDVGALVRQQLEAERINSTLDEFLANTERYPHAEAVMSDMAPFVAAIKQREPSLPHSKVLDKAYTLAVQANPDLASVMEAERKAKELEAKQAAALKARTASVSVRPQGVATQAPAGPVKGERAGDTLRRQAQNLGLI